MLVYLLSVTLVVLFVFTAFSYWQELKYRQKPYYRLSDVGWQHLRQPEQEELVHSVALLGDVGAVATDGTDPLLHLVENWKRESGQAGTMLFLGDNLYPIGLPTEGSKHRAPAEARLNLLIKEVRDFAGRGVFLSGNHDWLKGRTGGYAQVLRQERYVRKRLEDDACYLPRNGCPGPESLQLAEGLLLVIINTQWFVQRGEKPLGKQQGCPYEDIEQFFVAFNNLLRKNRHQHVLVAAHHPLYSNALHGGKFTVKQHIFPLTAAHRRFYLPLPIFGSVYPFYRKLFGAYEDMSHRKYKKMRKRLLRIMHRYNNIVYAAGHDHNLQHFEVQGNHYLVSGSGSKTAFVKKGGKATFTLEQLGFFVLNYYQNGEVWLEARVVSKESADGTVMFRKNIKSVLQPVPEVREV
ncbi:calcineurin-like phosphoesterase family protein [Pontibacter ummariensis]|uniref:Calcineurin-like phosphoesterase n=1 Tax=Pontibacter ummariensis TaxID=1610492 RepID=A0A239FVC4_9BACT|nr:metallophosphoesterase [Pontibacter ummariensis]PRY11931.1 calcineurin-like phosphoesterase family protein [Pontibacter ummariensis]SNS60143.1 Calcineurin-like phosphoesterase [Pontibacter ummariensis]